MKYSQNTSNTCILDLANSFKYSEKYSTENVFEIQIQRTHMYNLTIFSISDVYNLNTACHCLLGR